MKYLGWDSDYIINGHIYLKKDFTYNLLNLDIVVKDNDNDYNTDVTKCIKVCSSPTQEELIFGYEGMSYILHRSIKRFMIDYCLTKSEYREERLKKILDNEGSV